ncbi:hypothetical protein A2716_04390 [candidate division WWE3 bacterium RIFCSPHIGHO2_01_FULL_40_23]|uniref:HD domain-containing protein n=1 Tax=candidate division WWE3 bacterium RIFCSPLOWO2_01_FULL_41_18 TaxID=1802625 RepID=A0A1F4VEJ0_UNCKA|nr:MAG: hypothetical protein A2716_04390 [candidate division WWE3 bacterium RIFCSPHIGHO2_01_FULL_40_23]OGC55113.1 MAG: hypothetical protein A3A78_04000 [candidate division WWE3 bacterium RIFCSPLOWO2_01_FULL_41_18]
MVQILTPEDIRFEGMEPNPKVLTPEDEKEAKPDKVYSVTKRYGEVVSTLTPGFEKNVKKYEGVYEVQVPNEITDVCREIHSLGGRALLVGGSIRDAVISKEIEEMDLEPKDFDIEVYGLSPEQLQLILITKFGKENLNLVGESFKVLKVKIAGWEKPLDFSIPRRDSKVAAGHTGFLIEGDPTMTIDEASLRRDLTINSVAYDPLTQTLYDAYGGVEDIRNRTIEVTDINAFQEDPLRVMRVMQFAARFEFKVSDRTNEICKTMVERGDLNQLTRERISEEVTKLLTKGIRPSIGLEAAREIGLVEKYWPELHALTGVLQEEKWHPEGDVWTHTLQVVDAAAEIADREIKAGRLKEEEKLTLELAALCHDFGKPSTTKFIDGAYRAHGHEPAGVEPARKFIERIFGDPKAKGITELTRKVLPLVAEHLKPIDLCENEVKKGINQTAAIKGLARRLGEGSKKAYPDGGNTNIYMLALVAEADQRGRNREGGAPLERGQVPNLEEWQSWILNRAEELQVEEKGQDRLITGDMLLKELNLPTGDISIGLTLEAVYADQIDGVVNTVEEALKAGRAYYEKFKAKVAKESENQNKDPRLIWSEVRRLEDPRTYLESN